MTTSVIMLTYNRETLLPRAIDSILLQTFRDYEFIIINNGSTDCSGTIADEYATRDDRIRVIHRERGNIGSGRNAGLDAARGEWIAFIDDDDFVDPDYLEFLLKLAVENGADLSICGAVGREFDEKLIMSNEDALIKLFWRKYYNVQFPTKLIHRRLFEGLRFSETAKYDDIELFPKILSNAAKVAYHGLAKYSFDRQHGGNNSAWTTDHKRLDADTLSEYLEVYRNRTKWLCGQFPGNAETWHYFEWSFMISMVEKISRLEIKDCSEMCDKMIMELKRARGEFMACEWIQDFEIEWMHKYVG